MPSIKLLKKEINNDIGDLIEDIYLWELSNPDGDLTKSEKLYSFHSFQFLQYSSEWE